MSEGYRPVDCEPAQPHFSGLGLVLVAIGCFAAIALSVVGLKTLIALVSYLTN